MSKSKKSLAALMAEYAAKANPGPVPNPGRRKMHRESFIGWLERHGYDPTKITEDQWLDAMRRNGYSDDATLDYIESVAETVGMSGR